MTKAELVSRFQAAVRLMLDAREETIRVATATMTPEQRRQKIASLDTDLMTLVHHVDQLVAAAAEVPDDVEIPFTIPEGDAGLFFQLFDTGESEE